MAQGIDIRTFSDLCGTCMLTEPEQRGMQEIPSSRIGAIVALYLQPTHMSEEEIARQFVAMKEALSKRGHNLSTPLDKIQSVIIARAQTIAIGAIRALVDEAKRAIYLDGHDLVSSVWSQVPKDVSAPVEEARAVAMKELQEAAIRRMATLTDETIGGMHCKSDIQDIYARFTRFFEGTPAHAAVAEAAKNALERIGMAEEFSLEDAPAPQAAPPSGWLPWALSFVPGAKD
jgi:hypothetical protein